MTNTLSFCIFDDLSPCFSPITVEYKKDDPNGLSTAIDLITKPFIEGKLQDDSSYYFKMDYSKDEVLSVLQRKNYYVLNRYEKFYVIAFAINYTKFEIFSKDCDKKLIKWRSDDANDKITGIIDNKNYNENPVVTLLKSLQE